MKNYIYYFSFCLLLVFFSGITSSRGATIIITASGNWTTFGIGAGTDVIIKNNAIVTVDDAAGVCKSILIGTTAGPSAGNGTLLFNAGKQVTVSNDVTMGFGGNTGTITMTAGGTLVCDNLAYNAGTFTSGAGTLELTNTSTLPAAISTYNNLTFNKNAKTLSLGANIICTGNLTISNGTITTTASNFNITVAGNFINNDTFTPNSGTVIFNGTTTISGSTTTTFNNVTINSGKTLILPASINVTGNWTDNGGTLTAGTGTVTFNGTGAQAINGTATSQTFNNITVLKTVGTTLSVSGSTTTINCTDLLLSTGTFSANANTNVSGDFKNSATFTHNSGTVTINGAGAQVLAGTSTTVFYNLTVNKSAGTLSQAATTATVNNMLTMTSGTFSVSTNTLNGTGGITATGGDLQLAKLGATQVPELTGVSTAYAITGGIITLNGAGAQTIRPSVTYYNVVLSSSGVKTTTGMLSITNNLSFAGSASMTANSGFTVGGTLNYNTTGSTTLTAATNVSVGSFSITSGTFIDNGVQISVTGSSWSNTGGTFTATGTAYFNSVAAQSISGTPPGTTFDKLYKVNSSTLSVTQSTTVNTELNISAGVLDASTYTFSGTAAVNMSGGELKIAKLATTVPQFSGVYSHTGGTVTLNGAGAQTVRQLNYYNLQVSNSGTKTFLAGTTGIAALLTVGGTAVADLRTNSTTINFNGTGGYLNQNINSLDYHNLSFGIGPGTKTFASGTTKIRGALASAGAIGNATTNSSTIEFDGTAMQSLDGTIIPNYYNLNINNSVGVTFTGSHNLYNTFTLKASGIFINSGTLTLKSDISNTARIAAIPASASFSGNITMERYIPAISLTGLCSGYWHGIGAPNSSAYTGVKYDETVAGNINQGYNCTYQTLAAAEGGFVDVGAAATTITFPAATPNMGVISFPTNYTANFGIETDGWNLVSNPYPCEIKWGSSVVTLTGGANAAYVWDGTQYLVSMLDDGLIIPSCQGFWVKNDSPGTISFDETAKTSGNPTFYKMANNNYPRLVLKMSGNGYSDITDIRFQTAATNNYEPAFDALKLDGVAAAPHLATFTNDNFVAAINSYPSLTNNTNISMIARSAFTGDFTLSVEELDNFPSSTCIYIEDLEDGTLHDLMNINSFIFHSTSGSVDVARFVIHFGPPAIVTINNATCHSGNYSGSATVNGQANGPWSFVWKNSSGNIIRTTTNTSMPDSISNVEAGIYSLTITNSGGYCTTKTEPIVIGGYSTISPNQIISDAQCFGESNASINLSTSGGNGIYSFSWSNGAPSEDIQNISAGNYSVTITDGSGCAHQESFVVGQPAQIVSSFSINPNPVFLSSGNATVQFTNNSQNASSYLWNFGTGTTSSTLVNTAFTYHSAGSYTVVLSAINGGCDETSIKVLEVIDALGGIGESLFSKNISMTSENGFFNIGFHFNDSEYCSIVVSDELGRIIFNQEKFLAMNNSLLINMTSHSKAIYFVTVRSQTETFTRKVILNK